MIEARKPGADNLPLTLASLDVDGFRIVDFLDRDELASTRAAVEKLGYGAANPENFRISINQEPVERKRKIQELFIPPFQSAFNRQISGYRLMRVALFDKLPGGGRVRLHQHPHIIDESRYRSLAAWLPLVDTSVEMGTLHVLGGSHSVFVHKTRTHNDYRAFAGVSPEVAQQYSTPVLLRAGQAIIFDDRLLHWSPPNRSRSIRTAFQLELVPAAAADELNVYYRDNRREISKYFMSLSQYQEGALTLDGPGCLRFVERIREPYRNYGNRQLRVMMRGYDPSHARLRRSSIANLFRI